MRVRTPACWGSGVVSLRKEEGKGGIGGRGDIRNIQHRHLRALPAWLLDLRGGRLCRRLRGRGIGLW